MKRKQVVGGGYGEVEHSADSPGALLAVLGTGLELR